MKKHPLFRQDGISLVELVIVLALLSVVLAIGYNFYFFGVNAFATGEKQSNVQQNIRMSSNYIKKEIQFAHNMAVMNDIAEVPLNDDQYDYIYLDPNTGMLTHLQNGEATGIDVLGGLSSGTNLTANFRPQSAGSNILIYTISGVNEGQTYDISSDIYLPNVPAIEISASASVSSGGFIIRFASPDPPAATIKNVSLTPVRKDINDTLEIAVNVETLFVPSGTLVEARLINSENADLISYNSNVLTDNSTLIYLDAVSSMDAVPHVVEVTIPDVVYPYLRVFLVDDGVEDEDDDDN